MILISSLILVANRYKTKERFTFKANENKKVIVYPEWEQMNVMINRQFQTTWDNIQREDV